MIQTKKLLTVFNLIKWLKKKVAISQLFVANDFEFKMT